MYIKLIILWIKFIKWNIMGISNWIFSLEWVYTQSLASTIACSQLEEIDEYRREAFIPLNFQTQSRVGASLRSNFTIRNPRGLIRKFSSLASVSLIRLYTSLSLGENISPSLCLSVLLTLRKSNPLHPWKL